MYTEKGSHLAFFVPNIALAENAAEVLKEIDIGASSADHGEFLCVRQCKVEQIQITLTGEAASGTSVAPTVVVTKRPTPKSASGASAVGTITVPSGTAIGKTVYKRLSTPIGFTVGDSMHIAWTVGTGTPTGMGCFSAICSEDPETPANNSDMVASA
jgi:hypothetical protein